MSIFLKPAQMLALRYCLLKYYIILLKNFIHNLKPERLVYYGE